MTPSNPHGELDYSIEGAAWSGHHLVFADNNPVVERKLRRPALSPSVANAYRSCPARAAGDRLMPHVEDPFAANEMGTAFHAVMEDLYELAPAERTLERANTILRTHADEKWAIEKLQKRGKAELDANQKNRAEWVSTISEWIDGQYQIEDPTAVNVHAVELLLDGVEIAGGIPLKGFVDRTDVIDDDGEENLAVVDYKAGKPKLKPDLRYGDDYGDQMRIYVAGYEAKTGKKPASATLMFPRGPGARSIDLSPDAMRKTMMSFRAGWDDMNNAADTRRYEARPSALCSWCPLVNSCPMGKQQAQRQTKQNAVEARAKAPSEIQLGIPTLRAGAEPSEVPFAPGVTTPKKPGETDESIRDAAAGAASAAPQEGAAVTSIAPQGDDLFPATIPDEVPVADETFTPAVEEAVEQVLSGTVHMSGDSTNTSMEGTPEMNSQPHAESHPWEESVGGMLNLNSYAATAFTDVTAMAYTHLSENGIATKPTTVAHFTRVLVRIVMDAQLEVTGTRSFQLGANRQLRILLKAQLEHSPAPFGGTVAAWATWVGRATKFISWGVSGLPGLWEYRPDANAAPDYLPFASDAAVQGQQHPDFAPAQS